MFKFVKFSLFFLVNYLSVKIEDSYEKLKLVVQLDLTIMRPGGDSSLFTTETPDCS